MTIVLFSKEFCPILLSAKQGTNIFVCLTIIWPSISDKQSCVIYVEQLYQLLDRPLDHHMLHVISARYHVLITNIGTSY